MNCKFKFKICVLAFFAVLVQVSAQGILNPVRWRVTADAVPSGDTVELHFFAQIDEPWSVYAAHLAGKDGPLPIEVNLTGIPQNTMVLDIVEITPAKEKLDEMFDMSVRYFEHEFHLKLPVVLPTPTTHLRGTIQYQACNAMSCLMLEHDFDVVLASAKTSASRTGIDTPLSTETSSLLKFFLLAMLAGFAGVLTPCVFPMLPMTLSFFLRQRSRRSAMGQLLVFVLSIILIYSLLGVIVALTKSANFATALSTHWLPNLLFFALFVVFALSFLGGFDLSLPQKWSNKIDAQADKGGYLGAFFVALTLCVVSFSCTGPFVGALLVAAAGGHLLQPLVGMFGFGLAFALPFAVLGMFPAALKKLPKSGGWMNTLKVVFAFILLLFSMKFLTIADIDLGWNLISRELFLTVWITCFLLAGLYFLGVFKLSHDDPSSKISVPRFVMALFSFCATLYLATALLGNKIDFIEGFLPEKTNHSFSILSSQNFENKKIMSEHLCNSIPRFSDNAALTAPVPAYFDVKEARDCARQQNKPLLLYFKGHSCANCKKMQATVFVDPRVQQILLNNYIVAALYTDDKTVLPQAEWYTSIADNKQKTTMGQQNLDYLITHYQVNAVPFFAIMDVQNNKQITSVGYTAGTEEFLQFLQQY
ncbi:thiol:disulfide interchange protein DsbD [Bacteroidia bacterium]|nr:thiol:disulfide interchange protein DsbD [Bacteroidia bacterium]